MTNLLVEYFLHYSQTAPKRWSFLHLNLGKIFFAAFSSPVLLPTGEEATARMSRDHVTHAVEVTLCRTYKYTFHQSSFHPIFILIVTRKDHVFNNELHPLHLR